MNPILNDSQIESAEANIEVEATAEVIEGKSQKRAKSSKKSQCKNGVCTVTWKPVRPQAA